MIRSRLSLVLSLALVLPSPAFAQKVAAVGLALSLGTMAPAPAPALSALNAPITAPAPAGLLAPPLAGLPVLLAPAAPAALAPLAALPAAAPSETRSVETQASDARALFDGGVLKPTALAALAVSGVPAGPSRPAALAASAPAPKAPLWAPQTLAEPLPGDSMGVTIHRLSNGMTVYLSPNKLQPRVSAQIAVRAGSRQDPADSTGMAHYLEHMLFKGTERLGTTDFSKEKPHLDRISALYETLFSEKDPSRRRALYAEIDAENQKAAAYAIPNEYDRLQGELGFNGTNAYTSDEQTVYLTSLPANRLEAWARMEAERFARPVFRLFQSELEAVYEEYNRGLDNAGRLSVEAAMAATFKGHPYGRSTIGLPEHLKNPSLAKMYAYYDAWYRPENMAVVLSGDFDRAQALAILEGSLGALRPRGPASVAAAATPAPLNGVEKTTILHPGDEAALLSWRTPAANGADADAMAVLERLLGDSSSGLLPLRLGQTQKVKALWAGINQLNEAGAFLFNVEPKAGQTLEQAEALALAEIERIKAGDFTEQDVRAAVSAMEIDEKMRLESDDSRVDAMVNSYASGREWKRDAERLARLRGVAKADVVRAAQAYLGPDRAVVYRRRGEAVHPAMEKPGFTPIEIDPSLRSTISDELASTPAPEAKPRWLEKGKDYSLLSRSWGRLYWAKNTVSDLFELKLVIPGGHRADARLDVASKLLMSSGAGDMSPEAFEKALAALGTRMTFECGENECVVQVAGLDKNLRESLRLVNLRFNKPNIPKGALRDLVEIELGAREDRRRNPEAIGKALQEKAERGDKSAALAEIGSERLKRLSERELRRVLSGALATKRDVLYAGTSSPEEVARLAAHGRRSWRPAPVRETRRMEVPAAPRVLFVHNPGMVQAHIGLVASDGPSKPGDAAARRVYTAQVGGMGGVIFQEVREARSLAYSAYGAYKAGERKGDDGRQFGWVGTQSDKAVEAAGLMRDILKRPSFGPERFQAAVQELKALYRAQAVPFRDVPGAIFAWEREGLGVGDPRPGLLKRIEALRAEDLAAFGKRLAGRNLTIYVVGDRDKLDLAGLKALGEFREVPLDEIFPR